MMEKNTGIQTFSTVSNFYAVKNDRDTFALRIVE